MAQVHDGHDPQPPQLGEGLVREGPVVAPGAAQGGVELRAVAQEAAAELAHEREVLAPAAVEAAFLKLVPALTARHGRRAVLDAGGEHEALRREGLHGRGHQRGGVGGSGDIEHGWPTGLVIEYRIQNIAS